MEQKQIVARVKGILEVDGLRFKDLDGTGELKPYEDWRLSPEERARDLVSRMTDEEKAGMLIIRRPINWPPGISVILSYVKMLPPVNWQNGSMPCRKSAKVPVSAFPVW